MVDYLRSSACFASVVWVGLVSCMAWRSGYYCSGGGAEVPLGRLIPQLTLIRRKV
jgi:hypothetical protein